MSLLPLLHPVPIVLIGIRIPGKENKANFTTIGDIAIAGLNPPLVMLSLNHKHLAREGIDSYGEFSIIVPEKQDIEKVDYCGMVSGREVDKSQLFDWEWSNRIVPVIPSMPVNLICRTVEKVRVEQRVIYVARVIDRLLRKDVGAGTLKDLKTILYGLDNNYYTPGPTVGRGYAEGKTIGEKEGI